MKTIQILTSLALACALALPVSAQLTEEELDRYAAVTDYTPSSSGQSSLSGSAWAVQIRSRLGDMLQSELLRYSQLGLMVYDLTDQTVVFRHNERQRMRPASTMKLVSAITALDVLGGNYQFRTSLFRKGEVSDGVLRGNLFCMGSMDPTFSADDLEEFANAVTREGITRIEGSVVADKSMMGGDRWGEGWCWDDDNPTLSALLVERKDNFAERLVQLLRQKGITVTAGVDSGHTPQGVTIVAEHLTPIGTVLMRMMKNSDNLYAEAVFYQVAAGEGKPATAKKGAAAVKRLISRLGLSADMYAVADGSGLSLYNYVSPELMIRLLRHAYDTRRIFDHLYPVLPIAGVDGTLKNRMQGTRAEGNVHAKTGTVTSVSALAGYCTAANGHKICFSIVNQGILKASDGREFQNKVCELLCK
mgnify:CR=1 FL=1